MLERDKMIIAPKTSPIEIVERGDLDSGLLTREAEVVWEKEQNGKHTYVPAEIKRIGALFKEVRIEHSVAERDLTRKVYVKGKKINREYLQDFEQGKLQEPKMKELVEQMEKFVDSGDEKLQEIKEIIEKKEEEAKWLWRLENDKLSTGKCVRLIRLSQRDPQITFARKSSLEATTLRDIENERLTPYFAHLNQIIAGSNFDVRQKKAAQRIRLEACNLDVMRVDELASASVNDILQYLRTQLGFTRKDVGKAAGKSDDWVRDIEVGNYPTVKDSTIQELANIFEIPDIFTKFIKQKTRGARPTIASELRAVLLDNYCFMEDYSRLASPFSKKDKSLANKVISSKSQEKKFGPAFREVRTAVNLSQKQFSKKQGYIWKIESGKGIPEDYIVADLAIEMGFSILDETTQVLLQLAAKDREGHQRGRQIKR